MTRTLGEITRDLHRQRVVVVGDVMLDEYVWGDAERISPEAPVPVVTTRSRTCSPGGAANAAAGVAALGAQALLCGVVGQDAQGPLLRAELSSRGIESGGLVVDPERPTTTKTRVVARNQQVLRLDAEVRAPLPPELEDELLKRLAAAMGSATACILSDYGKGVISARLAQRTVAMARAAGIPVVADPKGRDFGKYRGATVVTPNVSEARHALNGERQPESDAELTRMGEELLRVLGGAALLITQGADGMTLFVEGHDPVHIPARARRVFDVTGAGDTAVSALAVALGAGATLPESAAIANAAAGVVVEKPGTATVSARELAEACGRRRPRRTPPERAIILQSGTSSGAGRPRSRRPLPG